MQSLSSSFRHAFDGIVAVARTERNFKIHLVAAMLVGVACLSLPLRGYETVALLLCAGGVLAAELFNSAIEAVVDLCVQHFDERAKRAKDAAAGAVLLFAVVAALVAAVVLGAVGLRIHAGEGTIRWGSMSVGLLVTMGVGWRLWTSTPSKTLPVTALPRRSSETLRSWP